MQATPTDHDDDLPEPIQIIVNGRPKVFRRKTISFDDVFRLALGYCPGVAGKSYTVIFEKTVGKHVLISGSLIENESIDAVEGLRFNVSATGAA